MNFRFWTFASAGTLVLALLIISSASTQRPEPESGPDKRRAAVERKAARGAYFETLYRDPATGKIPKNIRAQELYAVKNIQTTDWAANKTQQAYSYTEAGPTDVGGRTRAIVIDASNSNTVIAGAASGGIWKSTDAGATWRLVGEEFLTVTSIAQQGSSSTWYATTGEQNGTIGTNSSDGAGLFGSGIYKSTDGGESWTVAFADGGNPISWDSPLDYIMRVVASPTTGTVILTEHWSGVWRSADGGSTFQNVLGDVAVQNGGDVVVGSDGTFWASMTAEDNSGTNGLYVSTDDGATWTAVGTTPADIAAGHMRSVLAVSGDQSVAYFMATMGQNITRSAVSVEDIRFYKVTLGTGAWEDRSDNLPLFLKGDGSIGLGALDSQQSYNVTIGVHPTDSDHVFVGGTVLFRSRDGFATALTDKTDEWVGGYSVDDNNSQYANNHPDQHTLVFDPSNPNRLYNGHDGGISVADNVVPNGAIAWRDLNSGYNVTQFYTVSIARAAADTRFIGGTQDNGSPFFRYAGGTASTSEDVTTGDGAFAYMGADFVISSSQQGASQWEAIGTGGTPTFQLGDPISPCSSCGAAFVNPGVVDPVGENTFFYPAGADLHRWTRSTTTWEALANLSVPGGFVISALSMSTTPAGRLYYAAYSDSDVPKFYRLDSATTATGAPTETVITGAASGAYVLDIGVNPANADELMATVSNYGVESLFHSADGGVSWSSIEGNLAGTSAQGPSIRAAEILPFGGDTRYFVGTSTGLYSTSTINGTQTAWTLEASALIGNSPVAWMDARVSDGRLAVATHGRGIFFGDPQAGAGNTAPTANNVSATVLEDGSGLVTLTGSDTENDALTFSVVAAPTNGTLSGTGSALTYTPNGDYFGADSFTYTANDGALTSAEATASLTVTGVNDAPSFTAGADQSVADSDGAQSVAGWATGLNMGATNESGQVLSFTVTSDQAGLFSAVPAISAEGTLSFTPAAAGAATVTATLMDDGGTDNGGENASAASTFTITITGQANAAPVALDVSATGSEDSDVTVTLSGSDPDGGTVTYAAATQPSSGTLSGSGQTLTYTPAADFFGTDSFTYTVSDASLTSAPATATITVSEVNDAPGFTVGPDQVLAGLTGIQTVTGWATDISPGAANESGQSLSFDVSVDQGALFATAPSISSDGTLSYAPAVGALGAATVTAVLRDDGGTANGGVDASVAASFTITLVDGATTITGTVQFSVNMNRELALGQLLSTDVVGVRGSQAPLSFESTFPLQDGDGDGVFTGDATFTLEQNASVEYKFVIEDPTTGDVFWEGSVGSGDQGNRILQFGGDAALDVVFWDNITGVGTASAEIPVSFSIQGNYPNPFNPTTSLVMDLPEQALVSVTVHDLLGRVVLVVPGREFSPGSGRSIRINASALGSGTYVYSIRARGASATHVAAGTFILQK